MRLLLMACLFGLLSLVSVQACPGCKEPVGVASGKVEDVGKGFSYSVIFMLVVPASIVSGLGVFMTRTIKRLDREKAARVNSK